MSERPIVFLHIPKCAGTSIAAVANAVFGESQVDRRYGTGMWDVDEHLLNPKSFTIGHFGYTFVQCLSAQPRLFTMLRDPKERILSLYYYWRQLETPETESKGPFHAKRLTFLDFLRCDAPPVIVQIDNIQAWSLIADHTLKARRKYQSYSESDLLALLDERLAHFEFVGFQEHFDESLAAFIKCWGACPSGPYRCNVTPDKGQSEMLSAEVLGELDRLTHLDAALYRLAKARFSANK